MKKAANLEINQSFKDIALDDPFTLGAKRGSQKAGHVYIEGLYPFNRPPNALGNTESSPWEFWDSEFWETIPFNDSLSYDDAMRIYHSDASKEKASTYLDTVLGYFIPRAYASLNLRDVRPDVEVVQTQENVLNPSILLYPNPVSDELHLQIDPIIDLEALALFNMFGQQVYQTRLDKRTSFTWNRHTALEGGIYFLQLQLTSGEQYSRKVMLTTDR